MVVLVSCKNEEDPIENVGARVFTILYIFFSDAQWQITLEFVVVSDRNSNSYKLSCMSSLPANIRMIESKMKEVAELQLNKANASDTEAAFLDKLIDS